MHVSFCNIWIYHFPVLYMYNTSQHNLHVFWHVMLVCYVFALRKICLGKIILPIYSTINRPWYSLHYLHAMQIILTNIAQNVHCIQYTCTEDKSQYLLYNFSVVQIIIHVTCAVCHSKLWCEQYYKSYYFLINVYCHIVCYFIC